MDASRRNLSGRWTRDLVAEGHERDRDGKQHLRGESTRFKIDCFAVMRISSEEGSYVRLVDLLYHSTLGRE